MSWLLSIIIMLIMLAVLVSIHEAGHLIAAKIFHVYCFEYSIGFGPKILKVRRKGGETYFSIRAVPLGGYVMMYGEADAIPDGVEELPPIERSLEHINRGKKTVILLAGVTMNFILGLILIFISCSCFKQYYTFEQRGLYETSYVDENNEPIYISAYTLPGEYSSSFMERLREAEYEKHLKCEEDDSVETYHRCYSEFEADDYYILATYLENEEGTSLCYLLSDSVVLVNEEGEFYNNGFTYVAVYYPEELVDGHSLKDSIRLYPAIVDGAISPYDELISNWPDEDALSEGEYLSIDSNLDGYSFEVSLSLIPTETNNSYADTFNKIYDGYKIDVSAEFSIVDGELTGDDVFIPAISQYLGWGGSWNLWAQRVPSATTAIIEGLGQLFTGHVENLSSVVGMTAAIPSILSSGGGGYLFYYAGLISINLAIFNLLPFPPLDGWGVLVTIIEAISRKKVPDKLKTVFTIAGYVLIFALLIFVVIKDVISLV